MLMTKLKIATSAILTLALVAVGGVLWSPAPAAEQPQPGERAAGGAAPESPAAALKPKTPATPKPTVLVPDHVKKLIEQLGDKKFEVRQGATRELIKIGAEALPGLKPALEHSDPEVRRRARTALDAIMRTTNYLKGALKDADKAVRLQAAQILEHLGVTGEEMVPLLIETLKDKEEEVRDAAMMALISIDPDNKAVADTSALKASVQGKYGKLLRRIHVPGDKASYTEFSDYGQYHGTDYAGHQNLPAGYWVYVYPHWYIWGEQKK